MSRSLSDLAPAFLTVGGRLVGVSFKCPACADEHCRTWVYVDPPFDAGPVCTPAWQRTGDTFDTLSLSPSILTRQHHEGRDAPGAISEHWHGFVTNGQVTP